MGIDVEEDEELAQMNKALETGRGFDGGANLSDGVLCGPSDGSGSLAQKPQILRSPDSPSQADIDLHNLTHLPYMSWCPHCVATRRPNVAHTASKTESTLPLLVTDYCYLRDSVDQDSLTVLVARIYPWKMTFAVAVDVKGRDEAAIKRLASFIRTCGLQRFNYRSDQEASLLALVEEAIALSGREAHALKPDEVTNAAPELSSVGESQSNGKAERGIQLCEDLIRTHKSAFEARINRRLGSTHPVMLWLVEYASALLSKYAAGNDGRTAFQRLHGKRAHEKLVEFGEKVLYFIPKAKRAKLDKRFGVGVFLGRALWGDENFVARADGTVIRTRGLARMSPKLRWDGRWFNDIKGTPNDMMASEDANLVESGENPHAQVHSDLDDQAHANAGTEAKAPNAMRITLDMCKQYGYTKNCPRCRYYQHNQMSLRKSNHSALCRARIYKAMREANDDRLRENVSTNANASSGESRSDPLPEPRALPTDEDDCGYDP